MMTTFQRQMDPTPLSEMVTQFLRQNNRENDFKANEAVKLYKQFIPADCQQYVQKIWHEKGTLYVRTTHASLRFELLNRRGVHKQQLNEQLGGDIIHDIVFK